jgi:predicted AAA+ superfamily ATPase
MSIRPWRELITPHTDVLEGRFSQSQFAADLTQVAAGSAPAEYQDPVRYFERTFITEGLGLLLGSVAKRLAGKGGDPVVQLQTVFGGGKTHSMLAVYHLTRQQVAPSKMSGVSKILDQAGVRELPPGRVAILDGNQSSLSKASEKAKGIAVHTLWGEMAWQLGGEAGYALVSAADREGTAPGKESLIQLFKQFGPCVVLMDEMVAHFRQFESGKTYAAGSWESNVSFIQQITEAASIVPNAMMLASLPESNLELGGARGEQALETLLKYVGRKDAIWKPVTATESYSIVRQRLFEPLREQAGADEVIRAFQDLYVKEAARFPKEVGSADYAKLMKDSFPIHPEFFTRLYEDWSTLEKFQRTRGVLRLMALVIHRLWADGNKDPMVMPASLPLYDTQVRNEMVRYLPQGWDPVLDRDVDGEKSQPRRIDTQVGLLGEIQAASRSARSIFLGSAPSVGTQRVRGVNTETVMLGSVLPGQIPGRYQDALARLGDSCHYLYAGNDRYWYDLRANLRREMEEREGRFANTDEHVVPLLAGYLRKLVKGEPFDAVHVYTASGDVPDDEQLRLVVLPPTQGHRRKQQSSACDAAMEILKKRGDQPRRNMNRVIFLAADQDMVTSLIRDARRSLAWESIVGDIERLNLDQHQAKEARKSAEEAEKRINPGLMQAYRWVLVPSQEALPKGGVSELAWEEVQVSLTGGNPAQAVGQSLKDAELLVPVWSPVHLNNALSQWFLKDRDDVSATQVWQALCNYCYLARLRNRDVFIRTIQDAVEKTGFFGYAMGRTGDAFQGLLYGNAGTVYLDSASVLVKAPAAEKAKAAATIPSPIGPSDSDQSDANGDTTKTTPRLGDGGNVPTGPALLGKSGAGAIVKPHSTLKKRFYGTIAIDPVSGAGQFADVMQEVVQHFSAQHGIQVTISVEIEAIHPVGFDGKLQGTVRENARVLRFKHAEFESE